MFIKVKVQADAKKNRLEERSPDTFRLWVRAPAEEGRANRAVLELLAEHLGKPVGALRIIKGAHAPAKIIELRET
jgi:uncharacterized protein YggU (UPF0235/DUF167 family)